MSDSDKTVAQRVSRVTELQIDRALGGTPCVCGDLTSWHQECYRGKTPEQIAAGYERAYAKARRHLKKQRADVLDAAIDAARLADGEVK